MMLRSMLAAGSLLVGFAAPLPTARAELTGWSAPAGERVSMLTLEGDLSDRPSPLAWLAAEGQPTLRDVVNALNKFAENDSINELVIRLKDAELSRANIDELGEALKKVRASGKKVRLFAENYGPAELMLGAHVDESLLQTGGNVSFPGLYTEEMYLADTLAWIGVKPQLIQIGDYKGANEQYMNNGPSKAWDQNINQLLDSMYGHMRETIAKGHAMQPEQLDSAMNTIWWADGPEAIATGLINAEVDLPSLGSHINKARGTTGDSVEWKTLEPAAKQQSKLDMSNPFAMMSVLMRKPDHTPKRPTIAVLHIDGVIVDGESQEGGFMGEQSVGSRTIRNAIEDIRKQNLIKGVIVRIDSPGGSAIASEVIWQGLQRLSETKPVWVSIGDMAASGGYYIAVAGDKIYVNPSSIVGSIGVVGGKMSLGGLYEMGKVRVFPRARGTMASMQDSTKPWSADQVKLVQSKMKKTYDLFASRVSAGRPGIDLAQTAEGRLFTGEKAVSLKMADKIGGLDQCINDLAASVGVDDHDVMDYPGPKGLEEIFEDMFKGFVKSPNVQAPFAAARNGPVSELAGLVKAAVGPQAFEQVRQSISGLMQLAKEPVVLVSPSVIIFK